MKSQSWPRLDSLLFLLSLNNPFFPLQFPPEPGDDEHGEVMMKNTVKVVMVNTVRVMMMMVFSVLVLVTVMTTVGRRRYANKSVF